MPIVSAATLLATCAAAALTLDATGLLPGSARGLVVGALLCAQLAASQARLRLRDRVVRLLLMLAVTRLVAVAPRFAPMAGLAMWGLLPRAGRHERAAGRALLLLLPIVLFADTSLGTGFKLSLWSVGRSWIDTIAPNWRGALNLLHPATQIAFALLVWSSSVETRGGRAWVSTIYFGGMNLALNVAMIASWHSVLFQLRKWTGLGLWESAGGLLVICASAILAAYVIRRFEAMEHEASASPASRARVAWIAGGAAAGLLLGWGLLGTRVDNAALAGKRVLLFDEGHLEFKDPSTNQNLGLQAEGMFGLLERYLRSFGLEVEHGELTQAQVDQASILLIVNPPRPFSEEERDRVERFLARGGALVCAGDHTATTTIRGPINQLVRRHGIALNFDSAVSFQRHWLDAMRFPSDPINAGFTREEETQVWVGASLTVNGMKARPLLVGANAYSDAGDSTTTAGGYLGNLSYGPPERFGDIPLVAKAEVKGGGRILVFGDTSMLQNTGLNESWAYLRRALSWAVHGVERPVPSFVLALLLLGAASASILAASVGRRARSAASRELGIGLCATLMISPFLFAPPLSSAEVLPDGETRVALVDHAHNDQFIVMAWGADAIRGFEMSLLREGLLPLSTRGWSDSALGRSRVLAMLAPTRDLSARETAQLRRFLESGGTLLLSISEPAARACPRLRALLRFDISPVPLARASVTTALGPMSFYDAHAVKAQGVEPIASRDENALLVWRPMGRGGALIAGDPGLWINKNLEDRETWNAENVAFLRALLRRYAAGSRS